LLIVIVVNKAKLTMAKVKAIKKKEMDLKQKKYEMGHNAVNLMPKF